jgi:hypothetical protein
VALSRCRNRLRTGAKHSIGGPVSLQLGKQFAIPFTIIFSANGDTIENCLNVFIECLVDLNSDVHIKVQSIDIDLQGGHVKRSRVGRTGVNTIDRTNSLFECSSKHIAHDVLKLVIDQELLN